MQQRISQTFTTTPPGGLFFYLPFGCCGSRKTKPFSKIGTTLQIWQPKLLAKLVISIGVLRIGELQTTSL